MIVLKHAVVMAAGRGTRMRPMTDSIPKPMVKYGSYTLVETGIRMIRPHIENIHITVGYKGATLAEHVISLGVTSVFNTEGKGNAWWIYNTLIKHLDEPVVVLTADNVTELDFTLLAAEYKRLKEPGCMVIPVLPVSGLEGDYIHHVDNKVIELNRKKVSPIYCSGIQILNPKKLNQLTEATENFYSVWSQLIQHEQLFCSKVYPKNWFTIDTLEQLERFSKQNDPS
jgi:NDP-sugar pyrophosphorylase family protein